MRRFISNDFADLWAIAYDHHLRGQEKELVAILEEMNLPYQGFIANLEIEDENIRTGVATRQLANTTPQSGRNYKIYRNRT